MSYMVVDRVSKIYGGSAGAVEAVSGVSFEVEAGSFVSILGPSGCGKSTLLMMLAGLEETSAGAIRVAGDLVTGPRTDVGLIFQDATLLPWLTVLDNVLFPIRILKRNVEQHRERALELLEMVGLSDFRHHKPSQLSGGMRQRAAICRALIHDPHLLLMDEPFSALDAITRDEMNVALLNIWQNYHKTGIFITHSIREAVFLSDRVLVMTRRPSTVVCDVRIPFDRPRDLSIGETTEFNRLCRVLRESIESGYAAERQGRPAERADAAARVATAG